MCYRHSQDMGLVSLPLRDCLLKVPCTKCGAVSPQVPEGSPRHGVEFPGPPAIPRSYGKPALQSTTTTPVSNGAGPEAVGVYIVGLPCCERGNGVGRGVGLGRAFCAGGGCRNRG